MCWWNDMVHRHLSLVFCLVSRTYCVDLWSLHSLQVSKVISLNLSHTRTTSLIVMIHCCWMVYLSDVECECVNVHVIKYVCHKMWTRVMLNVYVIYIYMGVICIWICREFMGSCIGLFSATACCRQKKGNVIFSGQIYPLKITRLYFRQPDVIAESNFTILAAMGNRFIATKK